MGHAPKPLPRESPTLRLELPASPEHLHVVRQALVQLGLSQRMLSDARLLATELITNSIQHAGLDPADVIEVTVVRSRGFLRVVVSDGGRRAVPEHVVAGSIRPSPNRQSGWGLYLVDRLASRWGTNLGGRVGFWFELEESPGATRSG